MSDDVDGLVVPVGQAGDATHDVEGRPVVGPDVLVEPDVEPEYSLPVNILTKVLAVEESTPACLR